MVEAALAPDKQAVLSVIHRTGNQIRVLRRAGLVNRPYLDGKKTQMHSSAGLIMKRRGIPAWRVDRMLPVAERHRSVCSALTQCLLSFFLRML
jgi:hypothetical protein